MNEYPDVVTELSWRLYLYVSFKIIYQQAKCSLNPKRMIFQSTRLMTAKKKFAKSF